MIIIYKRGDSNKFPNKLDYKHCWVAFEKFCREIKHFCSQIDIF